MTDKKKTGGEKMLVASALINEHELIISPRRCT